MSHIDKRPTIIEVADLAEVTAETLRHINQFHAAGLLNGSIGVGRTQYPLFDTVAENTGHLRNIFRQINYNQLDEYAHSNPDDPRLLINVIRARLLNKIDHSPDLQNTYDLSGGRFTEALLMADTFYKASNLDFIVTGIGEDTHLGFIDRETDMNVRGLICSISSDARQQNSELWGGLENVPHEAITFGPLTFLEAKHLIIMISGEEKQSALKDIRQGKSYYAKLIRSHPNATIIADRPALGL